MLLGNWFLTASEQFARVQDSVNLHFHKYMADIHLHKIGPKSGRINLENDISSMPKRLQAQIETKQVSKMSETGEEILYCPNKSRLGPIFIRTYSFLFFICTFTFCRDIGAKKYFPSIRKTTVQGKVTAVTCHHGRDYSSMKGCAPPRRVIHHWALQIAWYMGRQDRHLQTFPTLRCCLKQYSSQTKHICGPPVCNVWHLCLSVSASPPKLPSRLSWHVIESSHAIGPIMMRVCALG